MDLNNLIINLLIITEYVLQYYFYILIASVLLSWLPELKQTKIGQLIDRIASPYMRLFRGLIVVGMLDFTPIIGFFLYRYGLNMFSQMVSMLIARG